MVLSTHEMVHIILNDGRERWASPGHPTIDGRKLGDLKGGILWTARASHSLSAFHTINL